MSNTQEHELKFKDEKKYRLTLVIDGARRELSDLSYFQVGESVYRAMAGSQSCAFMGHSVNMEKESVKELRKDIRDAIESI